MGGSPSAYADIMTLLGILLGTGLVAGSGVASLVYLDCVRRGLPVSSCLGGALACGGAGFGGFLVPYVFSRELQYVYFQILKPRPITVSPREWLSVSLTTGFLVGTVLVGLYLAGSRFRSRTQAPAPQEIRRE